MERTRRRDLSRAAIPTRELQMFVGALVHWGIERDYEVVGYDVGDIKEGIAGVRSASKLLVMEAVRHDPVVAPFVAGKKLSDHEWDAISVGLYHQAMRRVQAATIKGNPLA